MTQSIPNANQSGGPARDQGQGAGISLTGGAAIVAPITAFPNGVPSNAMVLIPLGPNGAPTDMKISDGPVAIEMDQVWKLLGFNGPAVQVQDGEGRPIAIGLEDLLGGLEKHFTENPDDLNRGRIFAQELMKYERFEKAETVLSKIVAKGGDGEDWLALGIAQLSQKKIEKAEGTLRGAQNLMKENPYPALHLAKAAQAKGDREAERVAVEKAISIAPNAVDAWAYLYSQVRETSDEATAIAAIETLADVEANKKTAAPYVALQGFYASDEATRDTAIAYAKKGTERAPQDPLALLCLSALYGQAGKLDEVVKCLAPHEAMMLRDVRLAHNYFEALFQQRDMNKVIALLNKLATSPTKEVKQFAIERSRAIADMQKQAAAQS
jgi:tetratricopeptide (TPR) repeat protein